jgi:hypothetical protein
VEPEEPAFPPTGELAGAAIVEGPGGALLGSVEGSLETPLPIWVVEVPAPAEPLAPSSQPRSALYNIGATATTSAADDAPFGLALPVPGGADTAHLALAVLLPPEDASEPPAEAGSSWIPIPGVYDPDNNLFSVSLYTLAIEGSTVVLIEDPDLESLAPTSGAASRDGGMLFDVRCRHFSPTLCGAEEEEKYAFYLAEANTKLTELGFDNPALRKKLVMLDTSGQFIVVSSSVYYGIFIRPTAGCEKAAGHYYPGYFFFGRKIEFCYDPGVTFDQQIERTATHELFHAMQHGFRAAAHDARRYVDEKKWIIEGTAEASERSDTTMRRSPQFFRPVDQSLTAAYPTEYPYWAQDFWVYFGLAAQPTPLGLDYLKPLFERGATTDAVAAFFNDVHGISLGMEYWRWAKNQVMEKKIDFEKELFLPCELEYARIGREIPPNPDIEFDNGDDVDTLYAEGTLAELASGVVAISFNDALGFVRVEAARKGPAEGLQYKVYVKHDKDCQSVPDGARVLRNMAPGTTLYVLLSNIQHQADTSLDYRVYLSIE